MCHNRKNIRPEMAKRYRNDSTTNISTEILVRNRKHQTQSTNVRNKIISYPSAALLVLGQRIKGVIGGSGMIIDENTSVDRGGGGGGGGGGGSDGGSVGRGSNSEIEILHQAYNFQPENLNYVESSLNTITGNGSVGGDGSVSSNSSPSGDGFGSSFIFNTTNFTTTPSIFYKGSNLFGIGSGGSGNGGGGGGGGGDDDEFNSSITIKNLTDILLGQSKGSYLTTLLSSSTSSSLSSPLSTLSPSATSSSSSSSSSSASTSSSALSSAVSSSAASAASSTLTSSTTTVASAASSISSIGQDDHWNWSEMILVCVMCILIVITVIGNTLVILSVMTTRRLRTVTNCFVMSLAVADWLVGLFVMPPAVVAHLIGTWQLGWILCDIWISLDILLCTASILSLCAISIDRYLAVTQPLNYSRRRRSKRLALVMILIVWVLALAITCPPILGWYEPGRRDLHECRYNQNEGYVVFSAMGSFFIPMAVMIYVYVRISCVVASRHDHMTEIEVHKKHNKHFDVEAEAEMELEPSSEQESQSPYRKRIPCHKSASFNIVGGNVMMPSEPQQTPSCFKDKSHSHHRNGHYELVDTSRTPSVKRINKCGGGGGGVGGCSGGNSSSGYCNSSCANTNLGGVLKSTKAINTASSSLSSSSATTTAAAVTSMNSTQLQIPTKNIAHTCTISPGVAASATTTQPPITTSNLSNNSCQKCVHHHHYSVVKHTPHQLSHTSATNNITTTASSVSAHPSSHTTAATAAVNSGTPLYEQKHQLRAHHKSLSNRISSLKRENKTTQTLSIVVGGFIVCWLPFFIYYLITPFIPHESVSGTITNCLTWLGWFNSAMNPFIYAFYSVDFRAAFWRLTFRRFCKNSIKAPYSSNALSIRR